MWSENIRTFGDKLILQSCLAQSVVFNSVQRLLTTCYQYAKTTLKLEQKNANSLEQMKAKIGQVEQQFSKDIRFLLFILKKTDSSLLLQLTFNNYFKTW